MRALIAAAVLFAAAPALAEAPATSATLADAATAPSGRVIVDGATWRCEGDACTATGGSNQPATRACRRTVAKIGPVTSFSYKGQSLNEEEIAACNAG
ncbi:CC_3452 family protein [Brevundimonas diminuta]|uniref:CC_3452 family protein n=1 Tax=Brevundimonas diminuta TaxID=293 RepID=UPI0032085987